MKVLSLYFSGTGNTEYVIDMIGEKLSVGGFEVTTLSIENLKLGDLQAHGDSELILLGYPIYGSMAPRIFRDFIDSNMSFFVSRDIAIIITQHSFSGDGGAYMARRLRARGGVVVDIEHFNMPSNISDKGLLSKLGLFKVKNGNENTEQIEKTVEKIETYAKRLMDSDFQLRGDTAFSRALGSLQRIPFSYGEKRYAGGIKVDHNTCVLCDMCVECCPMDNLYRDGEGVNHRSNCTLCYRCVNICPAKAISLFFKNKPVVQYRGVGKNI